MLLAVLLAGESSRAMLASARLLFLVAKRRRWSAPAHGRAVYTTFTRLTLKRASGVPSDVPVGSMIASFFLSLFRAVITPT